MLPASHVFVDESRRGATYLLAASVVAPTDLATARQLARGLLLPGQREIHFKKEKQQRRRIIVSTLVKAPVLVRIYRRDCGCGEEVARQDCVAELVRDLCDLGAHRLVIDSREGRDVHDDRTIRATLGKRPSETGLTYQHVVSTSEPLLWYSDVVAWCHGAGGEWRPRVAPMVNTVVDLE